MVYTEKITVAALPPYRFDLSSEIFANGDSQIRKYENGVFWQVIRVNGKCILVTVEAAGTVDKPEVSADLNADRKITAVDKKKPPKSVFKDGNQDEMIAEFEDNRNFILDFLESNSER